jgi:WD40 repeat protein
MSCEFFFPTYPDPKPEPESEPPTTEEPANPIDPPIVLPTDPVNTDILIYNGPKGKIAFSEYNDEEQSRENSGIDLWTINTDGSELKKIFDGIGRSDNLGGIQFSPNGEYILFSGNDKKNKIVDLEGNLIGEFEGNRSGEDFTWTPDGNYILYGRYEGGIYKYNLSDKSNQKLLQTIGFTYDHNPVMSPDLKKIVFAHTQYENIYSVKVMNSDGTNLELITDGKSDVYDEQLELTWLDDERVIWKACSYEGYPAGYTGIKSSSMGFYLGNIKTKEITKLVRPINRSDGYSRGDHIKLLPNKKVAIWGERLMNIIDIDDFIAGGDNKKVIGLQTDIADFSPDGNYLVNYRREHNNSITKRFLDVYDKEGNQYKSLTREDFPICPHGDSFRDIAWSSKVLQ